MSESNDRDIILSRPATSGEESGSKAWERIEANNRARMTLNEKIDGDQENSYVSTAALSNPEPEALAETEPIIASGHRGPYSFAESMGSRPRHAYRLSRRQIRFVWGGAAAVLILALCIPLIISRLQADNEKVSSGVGNYFELNEYTQRLNDFSSELYQMDEQELGDYYIEQSAVSDPVLAVDMNIIYARRLAALGHYEEALAELNRITEEELTCEHSISARYYDAYRYVYSEMDDVDGMWRYLSLSYQASAECEGGDDAEITE